MTLEQSKEKIEQAIDLYDDMLMRVCLSMLGNRYDAEEKQEQMTEILQLPSPIKAVVHLHYYEGYTCKEIGAIVGASEAAVKKRLQKGREMLKDILENGGTL